MNTSADYRAGDEGQVNWLDAIPAQVWNPEEGGHKASCAPVPRACKIPAGSECSQLAVLGSWLPASLTGELDLGMQGF